MTKKKIEFPETILADHDTVLTPQDLLDDPEIFNDQQVAEYRLVRKGRLVLTPAKLEFREEAK